MTKTDIDTLLDWFIDQCNDSLMDIYRFDVFEERLRGVFRTLYETNCKNFAGGECLKGGRCDGNCPRMKNYDKTH